jgi:hypothetical protein
MPNATVLAWIFVAVTIGILAYVVISAANKGPDFFFRLGLFYLALLVILAVARSGNWPLIKSIKAPIGGLLPIAVPWFGALGGVLISLYGVFDHADDWQVRWNRWHVARPFVGAILATIAYFIFIGLINATGAQPELSAKEADKLIPYYVLAFLVGFREATFRTLIQRAADILLGPGGPETAVAPGIRISPTPISFPDTRTGDTKEIAVKVENIGRSPIQIPSSDASVPGVILRHEEGPKAFTPTNDNVTGATIMPGALATVTVAFAPTEARDYRAKLIVNSNAGANEVEVSGKGIEGTAAPAAPATLGAPKPPEPPAPTEGRTKVTAENRPPGATESTPTTTGSTRKEKEDRP